MKDSDIKEKYFLKWLMYLIVFFCMGFPAVGAWTIYIVYKCSQEIEEEHKKNMPVQDRPDVVEMNKEKNLTEQDKEFLRVNKDMVKVGDGMYVEKDGTRSVLGNKINNDVYVPEEPLKDDEKYVHAYIPGKEYYLKCDYFYEYYKPKPDEHYEFCSRYERENRKCIGFDSVEEAERQGYKRDKDGMYDMIDKHYTLCHDIFLKQGFEGEELEDEIRNFLYTYPDFRYDDYQYNGYMEWRKKEK